MEAVPRLEGERAVFKPSAGEIPSPLDPPPACAFHPRCPLATERCRVDPPALRDLAPDWRAACHYAPPGVGEPTPARRSAAPLPAA